jgi:hypothetical protein
METFAIIVICGVPTIVGFLLARYCSHHCFVTLGFILALAVLIFSTSVPYAAVPAAFVTSFCTAVGYFIGRVSMRPKDPHRNA